MCTERLKHCRTLARRFASEEDGPTATEYAVMLALILMGAIGVLSAFGGRLDTMYITINDAVNTAQDGTGTGG